MINIINNRDVSETDQKRFWAEYCFLIKGAEGVPRNNISNLPFVSRQSHQGQILCCFWMNPIYSSHEPIAAVGMLCLIVGVCHFLPPSSRRMWHTGKWPGDSAAHIMFRKWSRQMNIVCSLFLKCRKKKSDYSWLWMRAVILLGESLPFLPFK